MFSEKEKLINIIETSVHKVVVPFYFEKNDADTWVAIRNLIHLFLEDIRKRDGLKGATSDEAFRVDIGLGSSMTPEDILNNRLRVKIYVALETPGVFTEIEVVCPMDGASTIQ